MKGDLFNKVIKESDEKIRIVKIKRVKKPSKNYTLVKIIDQNDRRIAAAGRWTDVWKEGDEVQGVLQEKVLCREMDNGRSIDVASSLFLANPKWLQDDRF